MDQCISQRTNEATIRAIYSRLIWAWGPQGWWPAETTTEMVVGAILTQNTAWSNVEKALANLSAASALTWRALHQLPQSTLSELIRPAGTFRVKARRLRSFVDCLWRDHGGGLATMLAGELPAVRSRLLNIHGIGPETADAIILYASHRPTFVVDAYTKRILRRHFLIDDQASYDEVQALFQSSIRPNSADFQEYHALLVALGKRHCRATAACDGCPLEDLPHDDSR